MIAYGIILIIIKETDSFLCTTSLSVAQNVCSAKGFLLFNIYKGTWARISNSHYYINYEYVEIMIVEYNITKQRTI